MVYWPATRTIPITRGTLPINQSYLKISQYKNWLFFLLLQSSFSNSTACVQVGPNHETKEAIGESLSHPVVRLGLKNLCRLTDNLSSLLKVLRSLSRHVITMVLVAHLPKLLPSICGVLATEFRNSFPLDRSFLKGDDIFIVVVLSSPSSDAKQVKVPKTKS